MVPKPYKLWVTKLSEVNSSIESFHGLQENLREISLQMPLIFFTVTA